METSRAVVDVHGGKLTLSILDDIVEFDMFGAKPLTRKETKDKVVFAASSSIALPVALLDYSSSVSNFPAANVGFSLGLSRPTTTPPLTPTKSQLSLPTTLPVSPANHSPFSEMATRVARVQNLSSQTQGQTSVALSVNLSESSPVIPPPLPHTSVRRKPHWIGQGMSVP
ncbi:hypothetical protein LWI28_019630 [Acer negundo]|uniref:Uncharacterized protein n=1 Tax=Acer negundo TaxID=4023 RepID=A0AAD5NLZ8_ACENE|nr:hypothetical protein LWI28_019630 [Acer negundo]